MEIAPVRNEKQSMNISHGEALSWGDVVPYDTGSHGVLWIILRMLIDFNGFDIQMASCRWFIYDYQQMVWKVSLHTGKMRLGYGGGYGDGFLGQGCQGSEA